MVIPQELVHLYMNESHVHDNAVHLVPIHRLFICILLAYSDNALKGRLIITGNNYGNLGEICFSKHVSEVECFCQLAYLHLTGPGGPNTIHASINSFYSIFHYSSASVMQYLDFVI